MRAGVGLGAVVPSPWKAIEKSGDRSSDIGPALPTAAPSRPCCQGGLAAERSLARLLRLHSLDDALGAERCDVAQRHPEPLGEHLLRVLAQARRAAPAPARR